MLCSGVRQQRREAPWTLRRQGRHCPESAGWILRIVPVLIAARANRAVRVRLAAGREVGRDGGQMLGERGRVDLRLSWWEGPNLALVVVALWVVVSRVREAGGGMGGSCCRWVAGPLD